MGDTQKVHEPPQGHVVIACIHDEKGTLLVSVDPAVPNVLNAVIKTMGMQRNIVYTPDAKETPQETFQLLGNVYQQVVKRLAAESLKSFKQAEGKVS